MSGPTSPSPVKGHCPECGPARLADVVGHYSKRDEDDRSAVWSETDYRILRCRGCEAVYFQTDYVFSEDMEHEEDPHTGEYNTILSHKITYWPSPSKRKQPEWSSELFVIDSDLDSLFDDIYVALNADLRVLAAIGMRTAFDRASELLDVDPTKTFSQKLSALVELGRIGESEKGSLNILTDAGSAAAHRGWKPDPEELDTMMSIIEAFIYRNFILEAAATRLKQNVPTKLK
jgi:Domain of unknown function (DUF4145)